MIGKQLNWTRGRASPATADEGARARARTRLEHERSKVAKLKTQLGNETRRVGEMSASLTALQAEHDVLAQNYQQLRKQLRWYWATHPETKGEWLGQDKSRNVFEERARVLKARLVDLMASPEFGADDRRVTAVVTSCGRYDLLVETLNTFFARNTYPATQMIVIEDGEQGPDDSVKALFADRPIKWINSTGRTGQVRAIDLAYSQVTTPYIFHMEDDWSYIRPGFIEKSLVILEAEPLCLQVWIKGKPGPRGHGVEPIDRMTDEVPWRPAIRDRKNFWHGFSFNPGLRRLRDYRLLGRFSDVVEAMRGKAGIAEAQIAEIYGSIGYFAAQLWEDDGAAFVVHIGADRHVA